MGDLEVGLSDSHRAHQFILTTPSSIGDPQQTDITTGLGNQRGKLTLMVLIQVIEGELTHLLTQVNRRLGYLGIEIMVLCSQPGFNAFRI